MFDNIAPKYDPAEPYAFDEHRPRVAPPRGRRGAPRKARPHPGRGDRNGRPGDRHGRRIRDVQVLGVDLSEQMLAVARRKIEARGLDGRIVLDRGDAERLAVADASVDVATVAFGVRNFGDLGAGLRELARTIKPGGKVVILEFSRPRNRVFRALYEFYSYKILPASAGWCRATSGPTSIFRPRSGSFPRRRSSWR